MESFVALLLVTCLAVCNAYPRELVDREDREERDERSLDTLRQLARRGLLDCKEMNTACRGFPPCCAGSTCYYANGWRPASTGVCVTCVDTGLACQIDSQCCEGLICQKATSWTTNGVCGGPRPNGQDCHDNDQCISGYCNIDWYRDIVMGKGGKCADRTAA